jgi:hypothetical protein
VRKANTTTVWNLLFNLQMIGFEVIVIKIEKGARYMLGFSHRPDNMTAKKLGMNVIKSIFLDKVYSYICVVYLLEIVDHHITGHFPEEIRRCNYLSTQLISSLVSLTDHLI